MIAVEAIAVEAITVEAITVEAIAVETITVEAIAVETITVEVITLEMKPIALWVCHDALWVVLCPVALNLRWTVFVVFVSILEYIKSRLKETG